MPLAQVQLANDAARLELDEGGVLQIEGDGSLGVAGGASLLALREAVRSAVHEGLRQLLTLRAGDETLSIAVQPLRCGGCAPLAMVLLGRRQLCPSLVVEMLSCQHALTLAERRIFVGLLKGERIAAMAKSRGVQLSTVRTQVAALRHKFGVRRISDLVRLAAELPPMAPALRGGRGRAAMASGLGPVDGADGPSTAPTLASLRR